MVVVLVEDLGGDVVRSAELLVEVTVGVVDEGRAEVDDLDLVELFVLLEQDVLRLQVTMHDISLVAVVDAGEDLFHEDSSIALAELTTLEDLVEELTTFADLSNQVIALLILEELVHLDDVRVIDFFENIDLIEKHSLLVVVHVALTQDFDRALGP